MVRALADATAWDDPRYFIGGPTRDQVKRIQWDKVKALTPSHWVKRIYDSDLCIKTIWGSELWLMGLDKPARLEGSPWNGCHMTEYATCKDLWDANLRPALADRRGWAILEGTPDFNGANAIRYEAQHNLALSGKEPQWQTFLWSSRDVLDADEIDEMQRTMDPLLFDQEINGSFVSMPDRAYHTFSETVHVDDKRAVFIPGQPVYVGADF
jgi:hypothetical protein